MNKQIDAFDNPPWDDPEEEPKSEIQSPLEEEVLPNKIEDSGQKTDAITIQHHFDRAIREVDEGRDGRAVWIPMAFPKIGEKMEIAPRSYTLVGGASGTGKTALVHQLYILSPYSWYVKNRNNTDVKLKIVLRNMERPFNLLLTKWVAVYLYARYGILCDTRFLMGRGQQKSKVSDELYEKVREGFEYFRVMCEDIIDVRSKIENPTGIANHVRGVAEDQGRFVKVDKYRTRYIPNDENRITLVILDHIGRISGERGYNQVENLKKMSEYLSIARDVYGFSPVVVCQFNRGIQETARRTNSHINLVPEERDFKGAGNMYEDSDIAMALFNPFKYGLGEFEKYDVAALRSELGHSRFRSLHVLKSNQGIDDFEGYLHFVGETGTFGELPPPDKLTALDYSKLANLQSTS